VFRFGKISGAVGAFAHLDPGVEERVCARLGLRGCLDVSTQVIQRDRYAEYLSTLRSSLQRSKRSPSSAALAAPEVREAQEASKTGQKGSSSMPHKRNPILSERICGMARTVRANAVVGYENVALWHERDISHSSAERIVLPDSSSALDYMLAKATSLLDTLVVYPENMLKNLDLTRGLVFSGQLMLALTQKGVSREEAYAYTQRNAMKIWDEGGEYKELIMKDADISSHLSQEEIARVFDLKHYLRNVEAVFERVFR
jgi:adenylosuccinate lyase